MLTAAASNLDQIVSLFNLTEAVSVPLGEKDGAVVLAMDLAEVAALALALSFFLRQAGNRAAPGRHTPKPDLVSIS